MNSYKKLDTIEQNEIYKKLINTLIENRSIIMKTNDAISARGFEYETEKLFKKFYKEYNEEIIFLLKLSNNGY